MAPAPPSPPLMMHPWTDCPKELSAATEFSPQRPDPVVEENRGFWSPFDGLKAPNNVPQNKHTDKGRTGQTDSLRRMQMLGGDSE
ncbi:hypothetical protein TRIATDRAFT_316296 [Trichoderma atroviride IMI 206040]|uniref:Uncharacterized protein n=1 Tax=Hypocrea atroviridis (strain ATCC 20476 / IMI 206040) TaxID=452589 RepID=G9NMR4_HYPAI|nr:uncharacterized protein TRIATDRAFT_316296 [Trichoderma atroviride IMI 206040]EHK48194.1 hypothetical protein TRIATDRAFT_316296 [Trichoderma atroviride IMI 206040]